MNISLRPRRPRLFCFGITCTLLLGCWNTVSGDGHGLDLRRGPTQAAHLGRQFKLRARQQVTLKREGLRIRFAVVEEDSRCPADVRCVWAGNARVRLEVSIRGRNSKSVTLNTNGSPSLVGEAQYQGYKVKLVDLSPYPRSDQKIAASDYTVTLVVTKE